MVNQVGEVLYVLTIGFAIAAWLFWPSSRASASGADRRASLIALVLLSASLAQHISGVLYQDVLGQHIQYFSPQFAILVK